MSASWGARETRATAATHRKQQDPVDGLHFAADLDPVRAKVMCAVQRGVLAGRRFNQGAVGERDPDGLGLGDDAGPDNDSAHILARSAAAQPASPGPAESRAVAESAVPAVPTSDAAGPSAAGESLPATLRSSTQEPCSHPPDARDYETGVCAACGAILWD